MSVFDYIEKELDRIEVGYTSYDGTRLTMSIDDVRELLENLRMKLVQNLPNACTDPIEREDVISILHDAMQGRSESEENLIGEIVSKVDLLSSVQPNAQTEPQWIPCSDPSDLPKDKRLWITREISDGFFTLREVSDVIWDMTEWSDDVSGVVAYMPYWEPEPYAEGWE